MDGREVCSRSTLACVAENGVASACALLGGLAGLSEWRSVSVVFFSRLSDRKDVFFVGLRCREELLNA